MSSTRAGFGMKKGVLVYLSKWWVVPVVVLGSCFDSAWGNGDNVMWRVLDGVFRIRGRTPCRTTFTLSRPTEETIHRLFDTGAALRYNHDFVGITNPSVQSNAGQVLTPPRPSLTSATSSSSAPQQATSQEPSLSDACCHDSSYLQKHGWRRLSFHRKVGEGEACYEALKDAIMGWERLHDRSPWAAIRLLHYDFEHDHGRRRIAKTSRTTSRQYHTSKEPNRPSRHGVPFPSNVMQIGPTQKNIVTMSRCTPWGLWTCNPCKVVYDLVDQRHYSPHKTSPAETTLPPSSAVTYTATAYGTLKGHLLSGEERVSVSIRDGGRRDVEVQVLSYSHATNTLLGRLAFPLVLRMQKRFFNEQVDTLERIAMGRRERDQSLSPHFNGVGGNDKTRSDPSELPSFLDKFSFSDASSQKKDVLYTAGRSFGYDWK